jgi:hypothetical protein
MALAKAQYDADLDGSDDEADVTSDWLLNGDMDESDDDDDFVPSEPVASSNPLNISRVNEADLQALLGAIEDEDERQDLGEQGRVLKSCC